MDEKKIQVWLEKTHRYCFKRCPHYLECWSHGGAVYNSQVILKICNVTNIRESIEKLAGLDKTLKIESHKL